MSGAADDPRVAVDSYVVRPSNYASLAQSDKDAWCLTVMNGHVWGWSVRQHGYNGVRAMNRKGEWIYESRGSGHNKARRWPLDEALTIALKHVDAHRINGVTAQQASDWVAARNATEEDT